MTSDKMIILTTKNIDNVADVSQTSSIIDYAGTKWCLAEVPETFNFSQEEIDKLEIDFWWEVGPGYIRTEMWDYDMCFPGGIIEGVDLLLSLSKEVNIAMSIYELSNNAGICPFELWENTIEIKSIEKDNCTEVLKAIKDLEEKLIDVLTPRWLSIIDAEKYTGISHKYFSEIIKYELTPILADDKIIFDRHQLDEWMEKNKSIILKSDM